MERVPTDTQIVQEKIRSALLDKVSREFVRGAELLFALNEIYPEVDEDARELHDETVRALCVYAAYDVGENTGTVIRYAHHEVERMEGSGYSQRRVKSRNNFMVTASDHTIDQKRGVTKEAVSDYDLERRRASKSATREAKEGGQTPPEDTRATERAKMRRTRTARKAFRTMTEKNINRPNKHQRW